MKKTCLMVLASVMLVACAESSSSSSAKSSSEAASSAFATSSSESSEELISSAVVSSSEELTSELPPIEGKKIYLFDDESTFFIIDGDPAHNPGLKTYRHEDHGEIPYVELDEFINTYVRFNSDIVYRRTSLDGKGIFHAYRYDKGDVQFDCDNQTVTIVDGYDFYGDSGTYNNGISYDMCAGVNIVKTSAKTKYIKYGEPVTYDLSKYHLEIASEDNRLYIPFGLANQLFIEPYFCSAIYTGRDFFTTRVLLKDYNIVRARSRNGSFSWNVDPGDGGGTGVSNNIAVMVPSANAEGDAYCFQGKIGETRNVTLHLQKTGEIQIDSNMFSLMMMEGTWKEEGELLRIDTISGDLKRTFYIDMSDRTYYNRQTRSQVLAEYNYNLLCMSFDYLYGLKRYRNISSFDEYFQQKNFKAGLTSTDTTTYDKTMSKFLLGDIDDLHTSFICSSFTGLGAFNPAADSSDTYFGPRDAAITDWRSKLSVSFSEATSAKTIDGAFTIRNKTAVLSVPDYNFQYTENGYKTYTVPEGSTVQEAASSNYNKSFFRGWAVSMNEILKHPEIKNIVFDLTMNRGGYVYNFPIFSAIMTDDPTVVQGNEQTGSLVEYHYSVDLDGDGIFGGATDTFKGKYNFVVLTSPASFSAGNITPAIAKSFGFAKIAGLPSAGGPSPVAIRMDSLGYGYRTSAQLHYPCIVDGQYTSNDQGVPVDIEVSDKDFYNVTKLDEIFNQYFKVQ